MECAHILAINPGSTSTKMAVFTESKSVLLKTIRHESSELDAYPRITDQFQFRKDLILKELNDSGIPLEKIEVVIGRGGLIHPIPSGVYEVNEAMIRDLRKGLLGEHASNLGGLIAADIARDLPGAKAYIADPVVVDELQDVARLSGHPLFARKSIFHALNQKAIARTHAQAAGVPYESLNLIIAHLGGGISVGAHLKGKVIDVNNALDGEGAFSPERAGTLPAGSLAEYCMNSGADLRSIKQMLTGKGGMVAYLGHNNALKLEQMAREGDRRAILIQEAMAYQVCKEIGAMASVLKGEVNAILLTGGIAYNPDLTAYIRERVSFIAPVFIYPGEDEMKALALNGNMVLKGLIEPKSYEPGLFVRGIDWDSYQ